MPVLLLSEAVQFASISKRHFRRGYSRGNVKRTDSSKLRLQVTDQKGSDSATDAAGCEALDDHAEVYSTSRCGCSNIQEDVQELAS